MNNFKLLSRARLTTALIAGFILTVILSQTASFALDADAIRNNTLRLHIIANSDTIGDQRLKLAVRDYLLGLDLFEGGQTKQIAAVTLQNKLGKIRNQAQQEVYRLGYNYQVEAEIANMYFDQKSYESYTLPAGYYDALRVTIGEATGKNWWCVLYPSLCVPAATKRQEQELSNLTPQQVDIIRNSKDYELRFASVDWYYKLLKMLGIR